MTDAGFNREIDADTVDRAAANVDEAIMELKEIKGTKRIRGALARLRDQIDAKAERIRGDGSNG